LLIPNNSFIEYSNSPTIPSRRDAGVTAAAAAEPACHLFRDDSCGIIGF
jgi:hypothetical protein